MKLSYSHIVIKIGFYLLVLILSMSCIKKYVVQKKYDALEEPIIVKHHLIKGLTRINSRDTELDIIDSDSIFEVFKNYIHTVDLDFEFKKGENFANSEYFEGKTFFRHMDTSQLANLAKDYSNRLVLIPVILIHNHFTRGEGITTDYANGDNLASTLHITLYLVKNNRIIYASSAFTTPRISSPYRPPVPTTKIHTQEDWEIVIRKAFRHYLKRLK